MAYRHDIFVSYRRDPEALSWISRFFKPIVEHRVGMELGHNPDVFVHEVDDAQIQAGTAWPMALGETIAHSRILIALWSGSYLSSEWCRQELSLMLDREVKTRARTARNKYGLVIPVVVHDGETIPPKLSNAQRLDVKKYYFSRMPMDGLDAQQLEKQIEAHAKGIAEAIRRAPPWRRGWPQKAAQRLLKAFNAQQRAQRSLPRFSRA